jgi:pentatricopeptide repeat protein
MLPGLRRPKPNCSLCWRSAPSHGGGDIVGAAAPEARASCFILSFLLHSQSQVHSLEIHYAGPPSRGWQVEESAERPAAEQSGREQAPAQPGQAKGDRRSARPRRFHRLLIKRLCSGGHIADAESVPAALRPSATIVTYNAMVNRYYRAGRIDDDARRLIDTMPFAPDTFTINQFTLGALRPRTRPRYTNELIHRAPPCWARAHVRNPNAGLRN